mmetsp:Transcript_32971/g.68939  ORF Transcript_32971/g.68939 Transcript_32971/m.68939 type:complete len:85 (-) Transcript_32971:1976-2230(-)
MRLDILPKPTGCKSSAMSFFFGILRLARFLLAESYPSTMKGTVTDEFKGGEMIQFLKLQMHRKLGQSFKFSPSIRNIQVTINKG